MTSRTVGSRGMASGAGSDQELFGIGTTTFEYDLCTNGKARLCKVTLPGSKLVTRYGYDAEGNTTTVERTFNFGFAINDWRRTTVAAYGPGGKLVTQKYADGASDLTAVTTANFAYDDRANPAQLGWMPGAGGTGYAGALGRVVANQTRNVAGLVTQRSASLSGYAQGWKNFTSDFTYDVLTRVASQTVTNTSTTPVTQLAKQQLDYFGTDDPARLRHWMGTTAYDFTYGYDLLHELTSVSEAAVPSKYTATFAYGVNGTSGSGKFKSAYVATPAGLAAGSQVTARNVTYDYTDARDPEEPTGLTDVGTGTRLRSYVYDDAGNQTEVHSGAVANPSMPTTRFVYDGDDQLRRATTFNTTTGAPAGMEEYYYDHDGHRVGVVTRNAAGTITKTRLFIGDSEVELTAANTIGTAYSYLSMGTPVAKVVSPTGGWTASNTTWANNVASLELQYHGLSSNTLVSVNAGGVVQSAFVYAPYGDVVQASGATTATIAGQRRRFNDKFRDDLTGLSYYGVRYYDGLALGWTQADPMYRFAPDAAWAEPRRAGLYQFVLGNPVSYVDPDGRDGLIDAIKAACGALVCQSNGDLKEAWVSLNQGQVDAGKAIVTSGGEAAAAQMACVSGGGCEGMTSADQLQGLVDVGTKLVDSVKKDGVVATGQKVLAGAGKGDAIRGASNIAGQVGFAIFGAKAVRSLVGMFKGGVTALKPEAKYLRGGKHGLTWTEGGALASDSKVPQGQWGNLDDLNYAGEMAATLPPKNAGGAAGGRFPLPQGPLRPGASPSVVHLPGGGTVRATHIWVRNNGSGTFHGYPTL